VNAIYLGPARARRGNAVNKIGVATQAIRLQDVGISWLDLNRFVKILEGESFGMAVAVVGFGNQFGDDAVVRHMAIDANGRRVMAALLPRIELIVHDVAVGARSRIGAEIRKPFRICEREDAKPGQDAEPQDEHTFYGSRVHR